MTSLPISEELFNQSKGPKPFEGVRETCRVVEFEYDTGDGSRTFRILVIRYYLSSLQYTVSYEELIDLDEGLKWEPVNFSGVQFRDSEEQALKEAFHTIRRALNYLRN
jgi:hypothetical protein